MSKGAKITLIIIAIILLLIFLIKKKVIPDILPPANGDEILRRGSQGDDVKALQHRLNECLRISNTMGSPVLYYTETGDSTSGSIMFDPLEEDGVFGNLTEMMLFAFTGSNTIHVKDIYKVCAVTG